MQPDLSEISGDVPLPPESGFSVAHIAAFLLLIMLGTHTLFVFVTYVLHYYDAVTRQEEKPQPPGAYVRAFLGEWWYGLAIIVSYGIGWLPPRRTTRVVENGGPPILLVHGYLMNRACMFAIYWRLRRAGYHNVYTINLWPILASIEAITKPLAARIQSISSLHGGAPVYAIAHSMGGIALRVCLHQDDELPVAKLITIGTAHHGTQIAHFAVFPSGVQMLPGSSLLERIADPPDVPIVSIYSLLDPLTLPPKNAVFGERTLRFDDLGHIGLLFSQRVFDALLPELPRKSAYETWGADEIPDQETAA
ncbi:MAG: hypothetical protein V3T05_01360 [Myxococcota bacterium]